jgi:uncharacterized membrane protein YfcA
MLAFLGLVLAVSVLAGATAAVAGFGIGSLLTPLVATRYGMPLAVAAVAIPHAAATALRAWRLRAAIDWPVLRRFGMVSAAGGLAGAVLYTRLGSAALTLILGVLLVATAAAALTGWTARWRPRGVSVQLLGGASGFFGGIAGNQGGLRAAALLAFGLGPAAYVATATMTGLLVDAARMPVYLVLAGDDLIGIADVIGVATAGTLAGTLLGERVLLGLSVARFRLLVSVLIGVLGISLIVRAV